jgi:biopolymer transport protein ExbD
MATQATPSTETPLGDMNTTPLIDVMLVMLIMFLITLPIQTHAVQIDMPTGGREIDVEENRITIDRAGVAAWNGQPVSQPELAQLIQRARLMQPEPTLLIEPHADAPYIIVDQTLALIRRTGAQGLGFVGNERYARAF